MKPKPKKFIEQPSYPGGRKALDEFIKNNLIYPNEALKNKVQGNVTVKYDFDVYGKVIHAQITHGIGYGCDEEALRVVKLLRYKKRIYKGYHVIFHQVITIYFKLLGTPEQHQQQQIVIQYQYTPTQQTTSGNTNFSYTITPEE